MPRQPHEQPSFSLLLPPPVPRHHHLCLSWGCVWRVCGVCGGEFKEAPPLFKIRCWEGGALCGLGRTPGLFSKGLPPHTHTSPVPAARVSRPGCCPREGFPLPFLLHFPLRFRGPGRKIGEVICSLATSRGCRRPRTFPGYHVPWSPAQQTLHWPGASTLPYPAASRAVLGPDVSLAFLPPPPRPRASGQELPPPAPVPRPLAAPNPAPRARRHE